MADTRTFAEGVEINAPIPDEFAEILTPEAVAFVATLSREFGGRVDEILEKRKEFQQRIDAGEMPDFLTETKDIREGDWKVAPVPDDLQDRRVEITGPPDRKMLINALNSGASTYMTDFEDANCPTWHNMLESQLNLRDAVNRTISFDDPDTGKHYEVGDGQGGVGVAEIRSGLEQFRGAGAEYFVPLLLALLAMVLAESGQDSVDSSSAQAVDVSRADFAGRP